MWTSDSPCRQVQWEGGGQVVLADAAQGRGVHSLTSQLKLSAFNGVGGAHKGCVARFKGVFRVCRVFLCVRHGSS
jgi:hypothetical protein